MIERISNLPSWRIGDFVFTFEQLEKLYYAIGHELMDVAVENGDLDIDPPDEYREVASYLKAGFPLVEGDEV